MIEGRLECLVITVITSWVPERKFIHNKEDLKDGNVIM